jgi:hypothetical protein
VRYEVPIAAQAGSVRATLLYQPIAPRYAAELFQFDTPEVDRFQEMYLQSDRRPEVVATTQVSLENGP